MSLSASKTGSRHELDDKSLGEYLLQTRKVPGLRLPILTTKIGYGQSNPTYYVDDATGFRFILRKRPPGQLISPVAHQIDREYRILQALGSVKGFPVPKVFNLCMDPSVIGTPFYVMEFMEGRIITDVNLPELSPADRRKVWFSAIETLAWLHSLDPDKINLESYGKKTNFYARHCTTWSRIEAQQATIRDAKTGKSLGRAHEKYDQMIDYIGNNLPGERYAIVHGDFKFDNLILHPTEPKVIGVLDWELSTIGHPLMDIVFHVSPYFDDYVTIQGSTSCPPSQYNSENRQASGMPELSELLDRYTELVGFDPRKDRDGKDWEIATIFQYIRGGTVCHGIQARTISSQASSDFSHRYFVKTKLFLDAAFARIKRVKEQRDEVSRL